MSLTNVTKGKVLRPIKVVLFAGEGVGKSTFASEFPKPIVVGTEVPDHINVDKMPQIKDYPALIDQLREIKSGNHGYKTLVLDSMDGIENLILNSILEGESESAVLGTALGGYGKGYELMEKKVSSLIQNYLEDISKDMNIIFTFQKEFKSFFKGEVQEDMLVPAANKKTRLLYSKFSDAMFYLHSELVTGKSGGNIVTTTKRTVKTAPSTMWSAKNRWDLNPSYDFKIGVTCQQILSDIVKFYEEPKKEKQK